MAKLPPNWAKGPWGTGVCKGVEVRPNEDGTIDEICAKGFHMEQMDDGLAKIPNAAERAAVETAIFGRAAFASRPFGRHPLRDQAESRVPQVR